MKSLKEEIPSRTNGLLNLQSFKADDKLTDKSDYHAWKMSLDLALEGQDVMDYV